MKVNVDLTGVFLVLALIIIAGVIVETKLGGLSVSLAGIVALVQLILTYIVIKNKK